jgi:hypothetical protein
VPGLPGLGRAQRDAGACFSPKRRGAALCESFSQRRYRTNTAFKATAFKLHSLRVLTIVRRFGGGMKLGWLTAAVCLISFAPLAAAKAQQVDPSAVIDQLTRWTMEDIARQRAKARQQEADDQARRNLPDLSQYGTPVEVPREARKRPKPSNEIHCRTIDLGGGDSATDCF